MWQKLNRIDTFELEKARIQLVNAVQLVSAAPRCYSKSRGQLEKDWLIWNPNNASMESVVFGSKEKVKLSLDIDQFVLSIFGSKSHIEHLVLSGITYPMAFGWLKIKLESFSLDPDLYDDCTSYSIERALNTDEELNVTNQHVYSDLVMYYSNAYQVLLQLADDMKLHGKIRINPKTLNLELGPNGKSDNFCFGFSPGDKSFPEPYFYILIENVNDEILHQVPRTIGIWNSKDWTGLVLLASDFLTLNPEQEMGQVEDFFKLNFNRLSHKIL